MAPGYSEEIAEWTKQTLDGMSLRAAEIRTNGAVNYSTIQNMLHGRRVTETVVIKFAHAFKQDIANALRVFGYVEMAQLWEGSPAAEKRAELEATQAKLTSDRPLALQEEREMLMRESIDLETRVHRNLLRILEIEEQLKREDQPVEKRTIGS